MDLAVDSAVVYVVIILMGKKTSLTSAKRAEMVPLHKVGFSEREIGKRVHVSWTYQAVSKFNILEKKYTNLKRCGL